MDKTGAPDAGWRDCLNVVQNALARIDDGAGDYANWSHACRYEIVAAFAARVPVEVRRACDRPH